MAVVAVEEAALLLAVEGRVGHVQIEHDPLRWLALGLQIQINQQLV